MLTRLRLIPPWFLTLLLVGALLASSPSALPSSARAKNPPGVATAEFPTELVDWKPSDKNPIFTAEDAGPWAVKIRERGWVLREDDTYHLWFTGYDGTREGIKLLGYATSPDGLSWTTSAMNPLCRDRWIEDMMVVKRGDLYYMFAEGAARGHAEMLTSSDRVDWQWEGPLDIRTAHGNRPVDRPCGTPTVWIENDTWYLFYERLDLGVWLAKSINPRTRVWTNVQDAPVITPGPEEYDGKLIALDQVVQHAGGYFAYYHASGSSSEPRTWSTCIARSDDLMHWQKFSGNPIVADNKSSGMVVPDGRGLRLYTMHDQIDVFYPRVK
jgi:hypothetical protein